MPILIQKFIRLLARLTLYSPKIIGYHQYGFQYMLVIDQILYSQWTPKVTMGKNWTVNLLFRDFQKGYSLGQHKCKTLNLL